MQPFEVPPFIIEQVAPHLYGGEKITEKGRTLYCYFEKIDSQNVDFWKSYGRHARFIGNTCGDLCSLVAYGKQDNYPNAYSETLGYSEEEYRKVVAFIQKKGFGTTAAFPDVSGGVSGMLDVISDLSDKHVFIAYMSEIPVSQRHTSIEKIDQCFRKIIISVALVTKEGAPTVSNFGIFGNPENFLDEEEKNKGLSMPLHAHTAAFALHYFSYFFSEEKTYMVTNPMLAMNRIFCKLMQPGEMHIGTNLDLKEFDKKSPPYQELLMKYPPLYHIDTETGIHKMGKEGVDLFEYLDTLPPDEVEFAAPVGETLDFCPGVTLGAMKTVFLLEKLATLFPYFANFRPHSKGNSEDSSCTIL